MIDFDKEKSIETLVKTTATEINQIKCLFFTSVIWAAVFITVLIYG